MARPDAQMIRAQLEEERIRLLAVVEDLEGDAPAGSWTGTLGRTGDLADAASIRSARADADALLGATRQRLERVDEALSRIEEGSYGRCEVCGEPIGAERLEVLPFTTLCVADVGAATPSA